MAISALHPVLWTAPSPLWIAGSLPPSQLQVPAILRFTSDTFMKDFATRLTTSPAALSANLVDNAQPQSFQAPPLGAPSGWTPPPLPTLKLFQPIHGCFYLVAASVVCQLAGLPDRGINKTKQEKVSFVLRRWDGMHEYAWASDPNNSAAKTWVQAPSTPTLATGEDAFPMFPLLYPEGGRNRHVHAGLIPTSNRETYQSAPTPVAAAGDQRPAQFENRVFSAYDGLVFSQTQAVFTEEPAPTPETVSEILHYEQNLRYAASAFLLLDFADLLSQLLPTVWSAIQGGPPPSSSDPASTLYTTLATNIADTTGVTTWASAIANAWQSASQLQQGTQPTGPDLSNSQIPGGSAAGSLRSLVTAALGPPPASAPASASSLLLPKIDPSPTTLYRVRCIFSRPACGVLAPDLLSQPTEAFAIAQYFDSDAPQRKIRIPMPLDTSIAGLRKFSPSVGFVLAKQLRQQMSRATDLKKLLDGSVGDGDSLAFGEICSFSIPIITICALLMLMIFVSLLNIVFFWMPFLKICIPVPEETSSGSSGS